LTDEAEDVSSGYLITDLDVWNPLKDLEKLPVRSKRQFFEFG